MPHKFQNEVQKCSTSRGVLVVRFTIFGFGLSWFRYSGVRYSGALDPVSCRRKLKARSLSFYYDILR